MKNFTTFLMLFLSALSFGFAQTPVTVCDQTIKIGGTGEENLYYGFAEGDQIILEFESDKELKEIQVFELVEKNSSQKYSNFKATSAQTTIYVPQKAVYQFRFKNGAVAGRICKIKIQRIPESEATQRFNTGWKFKTLYDTTYVPYTEDSLVGYKTIYYQEIVRELINEYYDNRKISDETPIIHSKTSSEGQYKLVPINMPINTNTGYKVEEVIDCYIILGLGDDAIKKLASAAAEVSTAIASIPGPQQAATAAAAATTKAISAVYSTTDDEIVYTIYKNYLGQRSIATTKVVGNTDTMAGM